MEVVNLTLFHPFVKNTHFPLSPHTFRLMTVGSGLRARRVETFLAHQQSAEICQHLWDGISPESQMCFPLVETLQRKKRLFGNLFLGSYDVEMFWQCCLKALLSLQLFC